MSTAAIIAIAIGVVVVLGAISFFTLARRSDVRGAGALSGETVHRDKSARKSAEPVVTQTTAADVEAAGAAGTAPVDGAATASSAPSARISASSSRSLSCRINPSVRSST